ncbi:hypothetical protein OS493_014093 [Desmophyllum pertusum]|uniref:SAM domain-containing protein n=1 Tax=Desmophyllum pertusum TaxID=174260 RepID=A0A9W9ZGP0_9CNID|nr:hypothetical protein OS493_014093 [Desmophyllum pertusum]
MGNEISDRKNKPKQDAARNGPDGEAIKSEGSDDQTDTVHPLNFDWTRSDVEPLWLYEHVEAAKWDVQEVAAFVKSLNGCSEYADSFVSQEIDGQALMLLREEHMVVAMHMKLGPALKIVANVNAMKREALKEHQ